MPVVIDTRTYCDQAGEPETGFLRGLICIECGAESPMVEEWRTFDGPPPPARHRVELVRSRLRALGWVLPTDMDSPTHLCPRCRLRPVE